MLTLQHKKVRQANLKDVTSINELIRFGSQVHRHMDWRQPTDWIRQKPFLVMERNFKLIATLACLQDPENIAWIRLFAVNSMIDAEDVWDELWVEVKAYMETIRIEIAVIAYHEWFKAILERSEFEHTDNVIPLQWDEGSIPPFHEHREVSIRKMVLDDLPSVYEIDKSAFKPLWQHSLEILRIAFSKSSIATVADSNGEIIGYQISTANKSGGHLARLAVLPEWQGCGIGYALVQHMLSQFSHWGTLRVTVNTQADNLSSLALYRKVGFRSLNEVYPVYQLNF